jgi:hypothetical protein
MAGEVPASDVASIGRRWLSDALRLWRVLRDGAIVVRTPEETPALLSVMQLDGDTMVFVAPDLFQRYATPESRDTLLSQHTARLEAALPRLTDPTQAMRVIGWGGAGLSQMAAVAAGLSLGWSWPVVIGHMAGVTPIALRWAGRPMLIGCARWLARREVRRRTLDFVTRYRNEGIAALKPAGA